MSRALFISGTGTDVGKTYISGLLVKRLRDAGIDAGYYKPALSGAEFVEGNFVPGDACSVCDVSGLENDPSDLVTYVYETNASPHLAARLENNLIELAPIAQHFKRLSQAFSYLIVEGAGGIACPFRLDEFVLMQADVIKLLDLEVVLVAPAGLGSIHSVISSVEYAKSVQIKVVGIILNDYDSSNFIHQDNLKTIQHLTGIFVVATVSHDDKSIDMEPDFMKSLCSEVKG
ncbi:MAG: dethiobiotin synthase [Turicibacter sp.]